jgi:hypothetical protein
VFENPGFPRCEMRARNTSLTLALQVAPSLPTPSRRKKVQGEPRFERPPLWIHASVAAFLPASRREVKRRKLLALLDRIPLK